MNRVKPRIIQMEKLSVTKLNIGLGDRSYEILIGNGLLNEAGDLIVQKFGRRRAAVLTDSNVWDKWGQTLATSLENSGVDYFTVIVPPGESSKAMTGLESLLETMAENGLTRSGMLIAFGGGVVGDLGGFASSVYMRGIGYIQIPTTLLSQVDSSVGGKTGVNLRHGKNLAGAFWQPKLVITDTDTLNTLPDREFAGGMAEVIKYGVIRSRELFDILLKNSTPEKLAPYMPKIIYDCCDIKRQVVEADERDTGERMILNLGHTFGHAIEKIGGYTKYIHGEAVAIGMVLAAKYGEKLGLTPARTFKEIGDICCAFQLPAYEEVDLNSIAPLVALDKKANEGEIKLILIKKIGSSFIYTTKLEEFTECILSLD